jgi:hypothetical protein
MPEVTFLAEFLATALGLVEPISAQDTIRLEETVTPDKGRGVDAAGVRFELHGYARMPLAAQATPREPFLVDNDYYLSGFAYTRLYEPDWSELFFSASKGNYKAEFGIFASLYSDYATPRLENQLGIAQARASRRHPRSRRRCPRDRGRERTPSTARDARPGHARDLTRAADPVRRLRSFACSPPTSVTFSCRSL